MNEGGARLVEDALNVKGVCHISDVYLRVNCRGWIILCRGRMG